jgi:cytochrome c oxidase subunit 2
MALYVISDTPQKFAAWWDDQLKEAAKPGTAAERANENSFVRNCGICHTIRGTNAHGILGPDLSHLMARRTIAAGILPNNVANLSAWIVNSQGIKPGSLMPRINLSAAELNSVRNFLERQK